MKPVAIHITSWLSRRGGGIPPVVRALAQGSVHLGVQSTIAGLQDGSDGEGDTQTPIQVISGTVVGPRAFGFSQSLRHQIEIVTSSQMVVHVHGLWMYPGLMARRMAKARGAPLIISPHGMLEPWALLNGRWKKRAAALLFERKNLRSASCLHALCRAEAKSIRRFGLRNPIAIIPNGIDLAGYDILPSHDAIEARYPQLKYRKRALFLSRLHPKKGLPHLLRAWKAVVVSWPNWVLLIAGPDEAGHQAEMKSLASNLSLADSVVFLGPVYGEDKRTALACANLFVLPSFSEGFSMAVMEAAACGLPVLLTPECNFPELRAAGGAIEVSPDAKGCEQGLRQMLGMTDPERKAMGQRARKLVERSYTWPSIAREMLSVYSWVLGVGETPDCVQLS
ncbi:MAG TPA: glycosyltransferase [Clostridia bacterium]|nr:glycosyltransferase [Clostridia bacterium]